MFHSLPLALSSRTDHIIGQLILLDDTTLKHIYGNIPGAKLDVSIGGWVIPTSSKPPSISFSVGQKGKLYAISGEDLKFEDAGNGLSFGSIQSRGGISQDILGDVSRVFHGIWQTADGKAWLAGFPQARLCRV